MALDKHGKASGVSGRYPNCYQGHKYAEQVVAGIIPACKFIIGACERYLKDLKDPRFKMDWEKAERYLRIVQQFPHVIGTWKTENIVYSPWQKFIWMNIMGFYSKASKQRRFRLAHVEVARGNAKALCLETDVPTPDRGLIKFKELEVGDLLYSSNGAICRVTNKNSVHFPKSYRIHFSDGTRVDCSDKHLWVTSSKKERESGAFSVKNTEEIFITQKFLGESNHSVKNSGPVVGLREDCQLAYVLGYWLGDGHSSHGKFTAHVDQFEEISKRFKARKLEIRVTSRIGKAITFLVPSLTYWLKEIGVLKNKHIPEKYFMADEETRRELLRGLMDSDGTVSKQIGNFTFCNSNKILAKGTRRLIASLGYKASLRDSKTSCQNGFEGRANYIAFSSPTTRPSIFGIRAKEDKRSNRPTRYCDKRYIQKVERIQTKAMFCIEVDSPDSTFLITDQYITTHNSAMASQSVLFFLALDNPKGNQISTVATRKEQARIVLDSARAMARKATAYRATTGVKVQAHQIIHEASDSKVRALSADASGLDGLQDILAVCDELHAMKRETFDVIYSGMSKRNDSLTLCITTAGFDIDSVGYSQSSYAKKVATGEVDDEQFFSAVYTLDDGDDIFDEATWVKANPGYGDSVDALTFKAKATKAMTEPSDVANFKVKHLNMWLSEAHAFLDLAKWDECGDTSLKMEDFKGEKCYVAIDVASKIDLASVAYIFERNKIFYFFERSYIPEETVKNVKSDLYTNSIASGHLIATPGEAIQYDRLKADILADSKIYKFQDVLFDPWNAVQFSQDLTKEKLNMVEFRFTTANISEPTKSLDALIRQKKIRHNGSPLLRWCAGNVVCKYDAADNVFPKKTHERLKIDPIIAGIMALAATLQNQKITSVYESRGLRSI